MSAGAPPTVRTTGIPTLDELHASDAPAVGGKAAHLGELRSAGFPVPPGFVVPAAAFLDTLDAAGLRDEVAEEHRRALAASDAGRAGCCERLAALVRRAGMPEGLPDAVRAAYGALADPDAGAGPVVAVRSSALGEDAEETSFAGMNASFTGVRGGDAVVARVVDCWASLFGARAVAYRASRGLDTEPAIAVVVQVMVPADRAGVCFTADPRTGDRTTVVVEAVLGQGETVVGGAVEPDTYELATDGPGGPQLRAMRIGRQDHEVVAGPDGRDRTVALGPERAGAQVLTVAEIEDVATTALAVAAHYGRPQDVEWAFADEKLWLVQARPVTTGGADAAAGVSGGEVVLRGIPASPGRVTGPVRVLRQPSDGVRLAAGEVLVAPLTNPDWLPAMRRAAAVVTEAGGATCHAAIAARELGLPGVVGTGDATTVLHDGQVVTVDGSSGEVAVGGDVAPAATPEPGPARVAAPPPAAAPAAPESLATKVMVNLAQPEAAAQAAARPGIDGVGLLRAEFLLTSALGGVHPKELIARGESDRFVDALATAVESIVAPFDPRPVVYRTTDLRSNEFRGLQGGEAHEPVENNPMIGFRGAFRYLREPEVFTLELAALARVHERHPNLAVMLPFVRTRWELEACLDLIDRSPLGGRRGVARWMMAEVPSVVYRLEQYVAAGIDGVSIGSNDLTQLVLGVDRDSQLCSAVYDEADEAVVHAIERIIATGRRLGVPVSLCGQAPSTRPAYVDVLVRAGITSVSVDPSAADAVRAALGRAERRVLLDAALADRGAR
ncbi:phosphoenolpyruvate synthase [Actinomycetospora sp.]|uniref:phosphoenolpyruvate synthase n=1 Tax=Actinomycetospora sp. TaxID=1872135 RepID=UPI0039C8B92A